MHLSLPTFWPHMLFSPYMNSDKAFFQLPISPSAASPAFSTRSDFTIAGKLHRCYVYQVSYAPVPIQYTGTNLRSDTWTEAEERRRIWWAVLIFDRYVHVGLRFRPLSTPNIPADELLPASDDDWDSGVRLPDQFLQDDVLSHTDTYIPQELSVNPLLVMSMEAVTSVSPFARACQAAHLLGRVCEHVNQHPTSFDADFHFQEALQISRALQALLTMLIQESERSSSHQQKLFTARGLAYAALITLYDVHSCVEPSEIETVGGQRGLRIEVQQHAIEGFKQVTRDTCAFAEEIEQACVSGSLEKLPMMVLTALHAAAGTYAWYARETGAEKSLADLAHLKRVMGTLGAKWGVACKSFLPFGSDEVRRQVVYSSHYPWRQLLELYESRAALIRLQHNISRSWKARSTHTMEDIANERKSLPLVVRLVFWMVLPRPVPVGSDGIHVVTLLQPLIYSVDREHLCSVNQRSHGLFLSLSC